ncbi:MAG TPA: bifunctional glutamate N-acetyltransferase/amino-acid acetyltransferase ArgJ [Chthoniobacterales bacterium]|nr:bifunctional glutamate N-acetyltransferase/amino-acid acetyltransferase ArgJ [Chthoniobacterales bacterium]
MFQSDVRISGSGGIDLKNSFREISGSICAPLGFKCASVFCDIKKLGTGKGSEKGRKDDLALIVSDRPAAVAGMFTTNQVCAAPVKISRRVSAKKFARAIVVNSGNANAATGARGMRDAEAMTRIAGKALSLSPAQVLVASTGRIGVPMPMRNVERGIRACAPRLTRSASNARRVAQAIMTTDTRLKEMAVELKIENRIARIGGICKGAGMIQPGMATMLCFITTDAAIESRVLKRSLQTAVEQSFNRITVDGDMSTNDSVIMLANGLAGNRKLFTRHSSLTTFQNALNYICLELAKMIVRDGEGTSRVIRLKVCGAQNSRDAELAARAIASSSLVRTSWSGGDPNWGRILCALGYSKAKVDESIVDVGYAPAASRKIVFAFRRGRPTNLRLKSLAKITSAPEFDLQVDLHLGRGEFTICAADLTEDYVTLNKGDVNDRTTLGG